MGTSGPVSDGRFPLTRHSVVAAVRSEDEDERRVAWEALVSAYWKPVYKYLRLQWRMDAEAARDATQEFFARAIEKGFFDRFDPTLARFRTFLRVCIDGLVGKEREAARRLKRGGGVAPLSLDFESAEGELRDLVPPAPDELDAWFHREWVRRLFELALGDLQRICEESGKEQQLALFRRYDLEAPERASDRKLSYSDVAKEFGVPVTQVTNWLHWTRKQLRELVLARLRELCATDDEFRAEARALLGVDAT
jgi:RNA polymerase sigma factor (sigma-70 family)